MDDKTALALAGVYSFYDRELSDFAAEVWSSALEDLDPVAVRAAFQRHLRDPDRGMYLPKPADIIRQLSGDANDRALIAWGQVIGSFRGGERPVDSVAAEAVAAMGGWPALGQAKEADNAWLQKRFVELYRTYARRAEMPPLLGGAPLRIAK
jgi:hypothetical protein